MSCACAWRVGTCAALFPGKHYACAEKATKWCRNGLHAGTEGAGTVSYDLSRPGGAYADIMSRLSCCVRDWWPDATTAASVCTGSCPADFACNE